MIHSVFGRKGIVTAPHHAASRAGLSVLQDGGSAVEAAVAMAATLAVVYPHMNGIGGDGFWLVAEPGQSPIGIDACGRAGRAATPEFYLSRMLSEIPRRGHLAINTVAGTVSGWELALEIDARRGGPRLTISRLLRDAIHYAEHGISVTSSQSHNTRHKVRELAGLPGFADTFMPDGAAPAAGALLRQPALARTLGRLGEEGLGDFYRGGLSKDIAQDLAEIGALVEHGDLIAHRAEQTTPLYLDLGLDRLFNTPPPTQGIASLLILAIYERLGIEQADGYEHIHGLVEATKRAFRFRDQYVEEPAQMDVDPQQLLSDPGGLDDLAATIDPRSALPWPLARQSGDTVWLGAIDARGQAVGMIQSIYFEFGAGIVLPRSGILWQNRGSSFRLRSDGPNLLRPGARPFHTLNPAMARLADGRVLVYGTMGGEGQPQTQSAIFTRYARFGQELQAAVSAPRWLLGRTWGEQSTSLKLENRFSPDVVERLRSAGHEIELLPPYDAAMGHAGALVLHPDGLLEGAADPRSDGQVAAF